MGPEADDDAEYSFRALLAAVAAITLALTACKNDLVSGLGIDTGPSPDSVALVDERVIVRSVWSGEAYLVFVVERVRFSETRDWHNVDRVVKLETSADTRSTIADLGLRKGDRLRISTRYLGTAVEGGSLGVPVGPATTPGSTRLEGTSWNP